MKKGNVLSIDDYTISKDGTIINNRNNRVVKPQPNNKGYLRVCIAGKLLFVHRLVAEKYIPNPDNLPQVNHKDGNKNNNNIENLEWVTNTQNRRHAIENGLQVNGEKSPNAKLTWDIVNYIREHKEFSSYELSLMYNVSSGTIRAARRGSSWK